MDWTINLMLAVMLTSITGTFVFIIWMAIGKLLERAGLVRIEYGLMKAVLVFWYVPFSFLALVFANWRVEKWSGFLFCRTPFISRFSGLFCAVWLCGVVCSLTGYLVSIRKIRKKYGSLARSSTKEILSADVRGCFDEVCRELRMKKAKVAVAYSSAEQCPKLVGVLHPTVILPERDYGREELRVFFVHELTHYRQRMLLFSHVARFAAVLHFFNPAVWMFFDRIQYWGELACDYESIPVVGGTKRYFTVIVQNVMDGMGYEHMGEAGLTGKKNILVDRMEQMKRSYSMEKQSKWKAALLVGAMCLLCTTAVSAETVLAGDGYIKAYFSTVVYEEEEAQEMPEAQEYEMSSLEAGFTEEIGEVSWNSRSTAATFEWTISGMMTKRTSLFSASADGSIMVMVTTESESDTFRAGLVEPDGTYRYVNSSDGVVNHTFALDQSGSYSVYVQNMGSSAITVVGTYIVK